MDKMRSNWSPNMKHAAFQLVSLKYRDGVGSSCYIHLFEPVNVACAYKRFRAASICKKVLNAGWQKGVCRPFFARI